MERLVRKKHEALKNQAVIEIVMRKDPLSSVTSSLRKYPPYIYMLYEADNSVKNMESYGISKKLDKNLVHCVFQDMSSKNDKSFILKSLKAYIDIGDPFRLNIQKTLINGNIFKLLMLIESPNAEKLSQGASYMIGENSIISSQISSDNSSQSGTFEPFIETNNIVLQRDGPQYSFEFGAKKAKVRLSNDSVTGSKDEFINLEYTICFPFKSIDMLEKYIASNPSKLSIKHPLLCGHRGSGMNFPIDKSKNKLQVGENTVLSMNQAALSNTDFVEFDVQLTSDSVPIIYHDYMVTESGTKCKVIDISKDEFLSLGKAKSDIMRAKRSQLKKSYSSNNLKWDNRDGYDKYPKFKGNSNSTIQDHLTTLINLLENLETGIGIDVEVKYPMIDESKFFGITKVFEMNWFVDKILEVIFEHLNSKKGENRPIMFSSFHPDICFMLSQKLGGAIPVLFLSIGGGMQFVMEHYSGNSLSAAIEHCIKNDLNGIISECKVLIANPQLIGLVKSFGLNICSFGSLNNNIDDVQVQVDSIRHVRKTVKGQIMKHDKNIAAKDELESLTGLDYLIGKSEQNLKAHSQKTGDNGENSRPQYLIDQIPLRKLKAGQKMEGILDGLDEKLGASKVGKSSSHKYEKVKSSEQLDESQDEVEEEEDGDVDLPAWINSIFYTICLIFVYGTFMILVNQQYGQEVIVKEVAISMAKAMPSIGCFVYFTNSYKEYRLVRLAMVTLASFFGCYFVHLNLHSPRLGVMKRAPSLITLWVYLTLMLDIRPAIISTVSVAVFWIIDPFKTRW
ncbi:Glycerophosphodiester phosphodiesterase GDE1 [Smittium culicis]|uniref:Glycerophosphodiester phosphodiesterase GDE1 n=2 Tax=Smittium culicis TaxID=133412 RepID=A0A1R1YTK2_9FUNG|nr:Glycerophosphodiester phosphodiesterase GDE1 [Smittium culicis]